MTDLETYRTTGLLRTFEQAGVLAPADIHVATRLGALGREDREPVLLAVALTVRALRLGSVCVEVDRIADLAADAEVAGLPWPDPAELLAQLRDSPLVRGSDQGPLIPLTLVRSETGWLLFFTRYHREEQTIRQALAERERTRPELDLAAARAQLDVLFPARGGPDRQRIAAALAATEWTTIVAGGPGTGKTHTAARILALLYAVHGPSLRVALAAPTGRAAARMQESVRQQAAELRLPADLVATTLHRLLGLRRDSRSRFTHHARHRLPYDVVIVDETSMVSLTLMARLMAALRPDTRLILLGDPDQLASVDAGAVLADLVARPVDRAANPALSRLADLDGTADTGEPPLSDQERLRLRAGIVRLHRGHRFFGTIAELADAVRRGAADEALALLHGGDDAVRLHQPTELAELRADLTATARQLQSAAEAHDLASLDHHLHAHRILCAHREGPYGVQEWNRRAIDWVGAATGHPLDPDRGYPGQPLLVTETDYDVGVSNGDTGMVLRRDDGLVARFDTGVEVHPSRLSGVQTAYAMTIHRSQGSQYDVVSIVLPEEATPILTRQLLYTAITRARHRVRIIGTDDAVRGAIERQALRASGLSRRVLSS